MGYPKMQPHLRGQRMLKVLIDGCLSPLQWYPRGTPWPISAAVGDVVTRCGFFGAEKDTIWVIQWPEVVLVWAGLLG